MKKYIFGLLAIAFSLSVSAQVIVPLTGTPMVKSYSNSSHVKTYLTYDSVTNTGTNYLTNKVITSGIAQTVSVQWNAVKISGTVAGTVTLQASLDGLNFFAITGNATVENTTISTFTATDVATQTKAWVIKNNPFPWYRVSWTGAGTMLATQSAVINAH
jgi:hypothetical protein